MIKIVEGNILDCSEKIIVHQVNLEGHMNGGLAKQLSDKYNGLEKNYALSLKIAELYKIRPLGSTHHYMTQDNKIIFNCFTQDSNYNTKYNLVKGNFNIVKLFARKNNLSIAIPYGYGCGIANGKWDKIYKIIEEVFKDYNVTIYKWEV